MLYTTLLKRRCKRVNYDTSVSSLNYLHSLRFHLSYQFTIKPILFLIFIRSFLKCDLEYWIAFEKMILINHDHLWQFGDNFLRIILEYHFTYNWMMNVCLRYGCLFCHCKDRCKRSFILRFGQSLLFPVSVITKTSLCFHFKLAYFPEFESEKSFKKQELSLDSAFDYTLFLIVES